MSKIYVVTDGEYSDYHIIGVCSTPERASVVATLYGGTVEEYELDRNVDLMEHGYRMFKVRMRDNGDTLELNEIDPAMETSGYLTKDRKDGELILSYCVWAENPEHAAKIVNEKRAILIASGRWGLFGFRRLDGEV